ncbi:uncharacterized protein [Arachis hypogaea]|uniref:uncharacterized protein n=1 Tax=Arachis hypogaea TaxID=3818 RepID=UPI000DEC79B7|nr:uncharacterized protein LOC112803848 [Arachis hypogaea]
METAKVWNKEVFGDIHRKKNRILARLNGISLKLGFEVNLFLEDLQTELWKELEAIFIQEEILWKQYSRCKWINYGDRNTSYFHNLATTRRRRNRVTVLKNQHGEWPYEKLVAFGLFPTLTSDEVGHLDRMVAVEEVSAAIFSMGAWKVPGPDDLPPMFYQSNWSLVKTSVEDWVKKVFVDHAEIKKVELEIYPGYSPGGRFAAEFDRFDSELLFVYKHESIVEWDSFGSFRSF